MTCDDARAKLTAYLDGELAGDRGSALRGHLRGCETCRGLADDEAALRDGLRSLPPLDPPNELWAGIQRRLAVAEVADADRPAWRRWLTRARSVASPLAPQLAVGSAALALAIGVLAVRYHGRVGEPAAMVAVQPTTHDPVVAPAPGAAETDVIAELAADTARTATTYRRALDELVAVAEDARAQWPDDRKQVFDARLAALRHDIAGAHEDRARNKAYRSAIRYLQGVAIRDEITANDRKLAKTRGVP